jgi:RNA recognition motif-containing protein
LTLRWPLCSERVLRRWFVEFWCCCVATACDESHVDTKFAKSWILVQPVVGVEEQTTDTGSEWSSITNSSRSCGCSSVGIVVAESEPRSSEPSDAARSDALPG